MTLSLLLASTLLATPLPTFPAGDECPNCGAALASTDDLDARIERVVRRVLAESGHEAPRAAALFGLARPGGPGGPGAGPAAAPKLRTRGIFVTDDGEAHEVELEGENSFFAAPAPGARPAPHGVHVRKGEAPNVVFFGEDGDGPHQVHVESDGPNVFRVRTGGGAPRAFAWTSDDGHGETRHEKKIEVRVDAGDGSPKTFTRTIVIGPDGEVHESHDGDASILHTIDAHGLEGLHEGLQGLHEIEIDLEGLESLKGLEGLKGLHHLKGLEDLGGEIEVRLQGLVGDGEKKETNRKLVIQSIGDDGTPKTFTRTIVAGPDGVLHTSEEGDLEVLGQSGIEGLKLLHEFENLEDPGAAELDEAEERDARHVIEWTTEAQDAPAPRVERRVLRRAAREVEAVDEVEAQIDALTAEIERLERRLERLTKEAGNS